MTFLKPSRGPAAPAEAIARAAKVFEGVLGPASGRVLVGWELGHDRRGRPEVGVKVSDDTGAMSIRLTADDLRSDDRLEARLLRFWGDFLEMSSHKLLEPILRSIREHEGR